MITSNSNFSFLSHLELDGSSSVTVSDTDAFSVSPLETETVISSSLVNDGQRYLNETQLLEKEHFR